MEDPDLQELLQPIQAKSIGYWFDNDANNLQKTDDLSGSYLPDVSSLSDGMHTIHYLLQATDGTVSSIKTDVFVKTEEALSDDIFGASISAKSVAYWFDEDVSSLQTSNDLSGAYVINVSPLGDGLHTLHYVLLGNDGTAYSIKTETFIKMEGILPDDIIGTSVAAKSFAYWFDDDISSLQMTDDLSGIYVLDVSSLSDGLHTLHYHVVGADGNIYGTTTTMFLKDEEQFAVHEPNRITKYMYWLNHDNSTVRTVTLDQPTNPYTLISLLPLQRMPIRSSNFHFQIDDGVPTIYAKNDFNIRFYDSKGEFVDNFMENERTFIDYGVNQQITNAELLESGQTSTIEKPSKNEIKWFCMNAEPGDSLEFKLDRAATIQLFSPSGIELYKVSGAESVKWGGCHVKERGVFYLALHDVTSSSPGPVCINYNHIDKYAILDFDVTEIGVAESFVPIIIQGNGFDKLKSASLCSNGNIITATDYVVVSKGKVLTFFHLNGDELLGDYVLKIEYEDEEEGIVNLDANEQIHLVTPVWEELKVDVASSVVTVSKTYVKIRVTNQGNVARLYTPLTISYDHPGNVSQINFENFYVAINNEQQEKVDYYVVRTDDLAGTGQEAESMFLFIPSLKPRETIELSVSCQLSSDVYISAVSGKSLNQELVERKANNDGSLEGSDEEKCTSAPSLFDYLFKHTDYLALQEQDPLERLKKLKISDFEEHLVNVTKAARDVTLNTIGIGRCISSINNGLHAKSTLMVMENSDFYDQEDIANIVNSVHLEAASDILNDAGHPVLGSISAVLEWQQLKSKCSKDYRSSAHIPVRKSFDPNDIFGYEAESGSKAIKDGLTGVFYTIEFENEPEVATASAHTVIVTDILDASLFDLSSFAATGISIGEKMMVIDHEKRFSNRTMDLRPAVNVIAQVSLSFDEQTGTATWTIESLDPMTMEPTEDALQGVLPVNTDGLGIGEVSYDIQLREGLSHGTEIPNQATIVFDVNEPITTPVWTNIIDAVAPTSTVSDVEETNETTLRINVNGHDEDSGIWKYELYVQHGENAPWWKEGETDGTYFDFRYYGDIDYGFCVLATDSAGNLEKKELQRERSFMTHVDYVLGDVNGDGYITAQDASLVLQLVAKKITSTTEGIIYNVADVNGDGEVTAQDASLILQHVAKKIDLSNLNQ